MKNRGEALLCLVIAKVKHTFGCSYVNREVAKLLEACNFRHTKIRTEEVS